MRNFTVIDAPQRSESWFAARAGLATGSAAKNIFVRIKTGEAAARRDYRYQLAVERLTGRCEENDFVSAAMQRGIDGEGPARERYESETGNLVRCTGFLRHNEHMAGSSLDGDIDDFTGILEVKCPKTVTHIGYLQDRKLPNEYVPQITHNLWVSGAEWADFVSFDDRLGPGLDYFCVRVYRADVDIAGHEREVLKFLREVEELTESLKALRAA